MLNPVDILQEGRKKKGLSQEALAKMVGISHRMLQRYEEGKFPKYNSHTIKKIDGILKTNLHELIYDKKVELSDHTTDLIASLKGQVALLTAEIQRLHTERDTTLQAILKTLGTIQANSETNELLVETQQLHQHAQHSVMLDALGKVLGKKPSSSLIAEADKLEAELRQKAEGEGRSAAVGMTSRYK